VLAFEGHGSAACAAGVCVRACMCICSDACAHAYVAV